MGAGLPHHPIYNYNMCVCACVRPTRQFRVLMTRRNWPGRSDSENGNRPDQSDSENGIRKNGRPDRAGRGRGQGRVRLSVCLAGQGRGQGRGGRAGAK